MSRGWTNRVRGEYGFQKFEPCTSSHKFNPFDQTRPKYNNFSLIIFIISYNYNSKGWVGSSTVLYILKRSVFKFIKTKHAPIGSCSF